MTREPFLPLIGTEMIVYDPRNGNTADVVVAKVIPPSGYGRVPTIEATSRDGKSLYILIWSYQWSRWIVYGQRPL